MHYTNQGVIMNDEDIKLFNQKLSNFYEILNEFTDRPMVREIREHLQYSFQIVTNPIYQAIYRYDRGLTPIDALQSGDFDEARRLESARIAGLIKLYALLHAWREIEDIVDRDEKLFIEHHSQYLD